jgi:hypothetical protein
VIRTAWLTLACLVVLGVLAAGKALTTPVGPVSAHRAVEEATVGVGFNQDTLAKGDRLEITYVRQEAPAQSALQPTEPLILPVPAIVPPVETKIISRHWHDSNAAGPSAAQSRQPKKMVAAKKGRSADPKGSQDEDHSKLTEEVKRCIRTGAFGDLLRSLNLSPACDS